MRIEQGQHNQKLKRVAVNKDKNKKRFSHKKEEKGNELENNELVNDSVKKVYVND